MYKRKKEKEFNEAGKHNTCKKKRKKNACSNSSKKNVMYEPNRK